MGRISAELRKHVWAWLRWGLLIAVGGAVLAYAWRAAPDRVEDELFRQQSAATADEFGTALVAHLDNFNDAFRGAPLTPADMLRLTAVADAANVYRMILRDAKGRAFWSTEPSDIGQTSTAPDLTLALNSGQNAFYHRHVATSGTGEGQYPVPAA